jgi:hypothetical protein
MTNARGDQLLRYWLVMLTVALIWHGTLGYMLGGRSSAAARPLGLLFSLTFGMSPYLGLALVAPLVRSRRFLLGATVLVGLVDFMTTADVVFPSSSTGGLALLVQPVLGLSIVAVTLVVALMLRGRPARARDRDADEDEDSEANTSP